MQHFLLASLLCSVAAALPLAPAAAQSTKRVSVDSAGAEAERSSHAGLAISADGRFAAFNSHASDLVPGDTNGYTDVFVHDRQSGQTTRVSIDSAGTQGDDRSILPSILAARSGTAVLSFSASAGGCGLTIQAVDLASCTPTNVIVL